MTTQMQCPRNSPRLGMKEAALRKMFSTTPQLQIFSLATVNSLAHQQAQNQLQVSLAHFRRNKILLDYYGIYFDKIKIVKYYFYC